MNEVERLAERVKAGEDISCMSTGEQIAAAFIFNISAGKSPSERWGMKGVFA